MNTFYNIDNKQIENLNNEQFVKLLRFLLYLEALNIGIPLTDVSVPLNINASDDGEDASIEWNIKDSKVKNSEWIKRNFTIFQSKAYDIQPAKCGEELFEKTKNNKARRKSKLKVKKAIENVFKKKGSYIFYVKSSYTKKAIDNRIRKIKDGLRSIKLNPSNIDIQIYDANKISMWANMYTQSALYVSSCNTGFMLSPNFKTWSELSKYDGFSGKYIPNTKLDKYIEDIILCSIGTKSVLRILGLAGLGKTRLILEAFKPSDSNNLKQDIISSSMIYYNSIDSVDILFENINYLTNTSLRGTIIVDNCDYKLHERLMSEISKVNCQINLITIDFEHDDYNYEPVDYSEIRLINNDLLDVIPKMLDLAFPEISSQDRERISNLVNGFPVLAFMICKQLKSDYTYLGVINKKNLIDKIIWGREEKNKNEEYVLIACSIFDKFGYYEELEYQSKYIATNKDICKFRLSKKESISEFKRICEKYIKRGLLEKRGRYLIMKPKPLAITLAAEWWREINTKRTIVLLEKLKKEGLVIALCEQLRYLDFLPEVKILVKDLCSNKGPFGKAEILNTEEGSRLFRSLVEVNPLATCETLYRLYGNKSISYIKANVVSGRRNLVWALEKLCWRNEAFEKAIKVLLTFAVGENENWANNATGIFIHLFQTILPGTEASLNERYKILEYGFHKSSDFKRIVIKATKNALKTDFFSRDVGAENQGISKSLEDYKWTYKERNKYWENCLKLLKKEWANSSKFKTEIEITIVESIRGLVSQGLGYIILPLIKELSIVKNNDWSEARNNLKLSLKYEKNNLSKQDYDLILELIDKLTPLDITKRYELYVNNPGWEVTEDENGKYIDVWKLNTIKYVQELLEIKYQWKSLLEVMYIGKQIQGYNFGEGLGSMMIDKAESEEFIKLSISKLESLKYNERNISVFVGFINGINNRSINNKIVRSFINSDNLAKSSFQLASGIEFDSFILNDFLILVEQNKEYVLDFKQFKYCRAFDYIDDSDILNFLSKISEVDIVGSYVSFSLLYNVYRRNKERFNVFKPLFRKLLLTKYLVMNLSRNDHMDLFEWEEIVEKILTDDNDIELATHIAIEIIDLIKKDSIGLDIYVQDVLGILLDKYFSVVWIIIGKAILEEGYTYIHIGNLVGSRIYFENESLPKDIKLRDKNRNGLLFRSNNEIILKWCSDHLPVAPIRLARFLPIFDDNNGDKWHSFTLRFINKFGRDKKVLSEISAKMGTYSWTGSIVPLLESEKKLYQQLSNHSFSLVRKWASRNIEYLERSIKRETNEDQELYI